MKKKIKIAAKSQPPADLWEELDRLSPLQPRPEGSFTIGEYMAQTQWSYRATLDRIRKLIKNGHVRLERKSSGVWPNYYVLMKK